MPYIAIVALQLFFVVHAVRTGRETIWIWILVFVPGIGCAAYFLTQILPELGQSRTVRRAQNRLTKAIDPGRELRKLKDDLAVADTQQNRQRLAEECLDAGMYADAIELYERCLSGPNTDPDDPNILLRIAEAQFHGGSPLQSRETLERLRKANPAFRSADGHLLYARSVEAAGDERAALEEYAAVAGYYPGEEARVRYALLLGKLGQTERARSLFEETLTRTRRAPRHYQRAQREWIDLARSHLG